MNVIYHLADFPAVESYFDGIFRRDFFSSQNLLNTKLQKKFQFRGSDIKNYDLIFWKERVKSLLAQANPALPGAIIHCQTLGVHRPEQETCSFHPSTQEAEADGTL